MAQSTRTPGARERSPAGAAELAIGIGLDDELRLGERPVSPRIDALAPVFAELLPSAHGGEVTGVVLEADRGASYGRAVTVLDALAGRGTPIAVAVALEGGGELMLEVPSGAAGTPAVAVRSDRSAPLAFLVRILDALARAGVERVILLSSLDLEPPEIPPPGTYPGGLPGGLELALRAVRREQPERELGLDPAKKATRDQPEAVVPSTPGAGGPVRVGGEVHAPVTIHAPAAEYTEIARKARIQGTVVVQAVIDERGDVTSTKVLKGLPMGLDGKAVEAIERWKFEPATRNGEPVAVYYDLTVSFRLQ